MMTTTTMATTTATTTTITTILTIKSILFEKFVNMNVSGHGLVNVQVYYVEGQEDKNSR